jgi:regulator of sirC expression with transglutaminase-like and TPR domain
VADYTRAIVLSPSLPQPYLSRGRIYYQQGRQAEALADFRAYVQIVGEANADPEIVRLIEELAAVTGQ